MAVYAPILHPLDLLWALNIIQIVLGVAILGFILCAVLVAIRRQ